LVRGLVNQRIPPLEQVRLLAWTNHQIIDAGTTEILQNRVGCAGQGAKSQGRLADVRYLNHLPHQHPTVDSALHDAGYATWPVGKWNLGDTGSLPTDHGFQVNIGGCHFGHPKHGYWAPEQIANLPDAADGTYLTDHARD